MSVNYQKLYSYLVGQIDETLREIAGYAMTQTAGRTELFVVGDKLKNALLCAEDMYLDETADEED